MGIRGAQRARVLQETMGIDTGSDSVRNFEERGAHARPLQTRNAIDSRVAEYVASVSRSNPSSPNTRADAAPTTTAMTAPHHYFSSSDDDAGSRTSQGSSGGSESDHDAVEPSQGSSEQEHDSDLEDLDRGDLTEDELRARLDAIEQRKQVLDREYQEAIEDMPDEHTKAREKMSKEWRKEIFDLQHRAALMRGALDRELYKNNCIRTATEERRKEKAIQTGLIGLLKFGVVVILAIFSKFAMQLFHKFSDEMFGAERNDDW